MKGAGSYLHDSIVDWTGEEPNLSCSCAGWIKRMDTKGTAWCRKNLNKIVTRLTKEAKKRAKKWRIVPAANLGGVFKSAVKGSFAVPGLKVMLRPFIQGMVLSAIRKAERDEEAANGPERVF